MVKITHGAFFGDAERQFCLTDDAILELERVTNTGIGALYLRAVALSFTINDVAETIRLALIGGGATPAEAAQLVKTYVRNRPMSETFPLALDILDARWNGAPEVAA